MLGHTSAQLAGRTSSNRARRAATWSEPWLHQQLDALQAQLLDQPCSQAARRRLAEAADAIVDLAQQPTMLAALRGRRDPDEALRDLATRYAFEALMIQGLPFHQLDPLSQALVQSTLDELHRRAGEVAAHLGENPLDADDRLLVDICRSLAGYVPHKPMGGHIAFKLSRPESAASRAMRQIEHLVEHAQVRDSFVAFVLHVRLAPPVLERLEKSSHDEHAAERFRARLALLARGGGIKGLDWEATIRFFAQPETVAFVKCFAARVQPARTLYAEDEYAGVAWQGRRLPAARRQGYLEAALAQLEHLHDRSLDDRDQAGDGEDDHAAGLGWHEKLSAAPDRYDLDTAPSRSFECWVVDTALDHCPDDPVWQAGELIHGQGLSPDAALAQGKVDPATLAALQQRLAGLQSQATLRQAWQEACQR